MRTPPLTLFALAVSLSALGDRANGFARISNFVPSPDTRHGAVAVQPGGAEQNAARSGISGIQTNP